MRRILITGGTGFVGRRLLEVLTQTWSELEILAAVRSMPSKPFLGESDSPSKVKYVTIGDIGPNTEWPILLGVDAVIHLAARTHVMKESAPDPLALYRQANTATTINLAKQAAAAGVKRFLFLSSIKVNGEETLPAEAFTELSTPAPLDPYGISKLEAEEGLQKVCSENGAKMEYVIIRAPLIYGPGVKANFHKLMSLLASRPDNILGSLMPWPLGSIHNQRSFLALDNLIDFICLAITHSKAANQVFLLADGADLSTPELIHMISRGMYQRPPLLIPFPVGLMRTLGGLLGMSAAVQRLASSLQVNSTKARTLLNWQPPLKAKDAIALTAQAFLAERKTGARSK